MRNIPGNRHLITKCLLSVSILLNFIETDEYNTDTDFKKFIVWK